MSYSANFEKVKYFYAMKLWNESRVRAAVEKGWITAEEFKEITGTDY